MFGPSHLPGLLSIQQPANDFHWNASEKWPFLGLDILLSSDWSVAPIPGFSLANPETALELYGTNDSLMIVEALAVKLGQKENSVSFNCLNILYCSTFPLNSHWLLKSNESY